MPGLAAVLAAEALDFVRGEHYVECAQAALANGFETPSILRLAIEEPPYFTPDLQTLFHAAMAELDIEPVTAEQAMVIYARGLAADITSGNVTPREGARRLASVFPAHAAMPEEVADWWRLDEAYRRRRSHRSAPAAEPRLARAE